VPNNLVNGQLPPNTVPTFNVTNGSAPNNCQNNALTTARQARHLLLERRTIRAE